MQDHDQESGSANEHVKMPKQFVADFNLVIETLQRLRPAEWPEPDVAMLVEEAKGVVRRDPASAIEWYTANAKAIRETGELL
jgi:hypothetical protein